MKRSRNKPGRLLQEADSEMVTVMLDTEVCSGPIIMSRADALQCKRLLNAAEVQDFPKEVLRIVNRNKSVPVFGRINTSGEGSGWSDGV